MSTTALTAGSTSGFSGVERCGPGKSGMFVRTISDREKRHRTTCGNRFSLNRSCRCCACCFVLRRDRQRRSRDTGVTATELKVRHGDGGGEEHMDHITRSIDRQDTHRRKLPKFSANRHVPTIFFATHLHQQSAITTIILLLLLCCTVVVVRQDIFNSRIHGSIPTSHNNKKTKCFWDSTKLTQRFYQQITA